MEAIVLSTALNIAADLFFTDYHPLNTDSEDDEDSEDEFIMWSITATHPNKIRKKTNQSIKILQRIGDGFEGQFRIKRSTFEWLVNEFAEDLRKTEVRGRPKLEPQRTILLSVWVLTNRETIGGACDRFGVSKGHGYRIFTDFCELMKKHQSRFIRWPAGAELAKTRLGFQALATEPFPNVVGCLGATYVPIKGSRMDAEVYYTDEGFKAVILQAVCASDLRFVNVFAGWPGSASNATVWKNSSLYQTLVDDAGSLLPPNTHLIANVSYPLDHFLLVPYDRLLAPKHRTFNRILDSTLEVIDDAFGLLKSRCQRLHFLDMTRMDRIPLVIGAACTLHNICIDLGDDLDGALSKKKDDNVEVGLAHRIPDGESKREAIANTLVF